MQRQPFCLAGMLHTSALARMDLTPVAVSPSPPLGTLDVRRHARQRQQTRRDARMAVLVARQPSLPLTVGMAPRTGTTGGWLVIAVHMTLRAHERKNPLVTAGITARILSVR